MLTVKNHSKNMIIRSQQGVAVVEFAIVAALLFILLFGILEFGRMFFVLNTVQEVSRRAAREAVVRWTDGTSSIAPATPSVKTLALFGGTAMPAGAEITADNILIEYLGTDGVKITTGMPPSAPDNISACLNPGGTYKCIGFVRVSIINARYVPMVGFFSGVKLTALPFSEENPFVIDLSVPIPASTVTMPAESMGYTG